MTENQNNQEQTETKQPIEETTEHYFNVKAMVLAVGTAGIGGYILGSKRGVKQGYMQGLKDGITQGLAEGQLEGYVKAFSDVASVFRTTDE